MFNFFKWILGKPDSNGVQEAKLRDFLDEDIATQAADIGNTVKDLAFWCCVRRIGTAVASTEIKTMKNSRETRGAEWWTWNQSPNPNQTKEQFFTALTARLFTLGEALIVEYRGFRYVADDGYSVSKSLTGNTYSGIASDSQTIPGTFTADNVIRLTLEGTGMKSILDAIGSEGDELIKAAAKNYIKRSGTHGILKIDATAEADPDFEEKYADIAGKKFKKYLTSQDAVLPLFEGYNYSPDASVGDPSDTRDIRALMDDVTEYVAAAMGIPASVALGKNVTQADFNYFVTMCVQPIVNQLIQELNRKLYRRLAVISGTYAAADYSGIQYRDVFDIANPIDKLIGSGAFCVNDILKRLGMPLIEEDWANAHFMTKNYSKVEDIADPLGGEGEA